MIGKINKNGELYIERCGKMGIQYCPLTSIQEGAEACGVWCPLFGEPFVDPNYVDFRNDNKETRRTKLQICQGRTLVFDEFTDER